MAGSSRVVMVAMSAVIVLLALTSSVSAQSCRCEEMLHEGMGYLYCSCQKTWEAANTYCADSYQGQLAIIKDAGLQALLKDHLDKNGALDTWIGARGDVGDWHWIHDQRNIAFQGCFQDDPINRDLSFDVRMPTGVTPTNCVAECKRNGYKYAGLQAGSLCFCGNSFGQHGFNTDCSSPCSGDFNLNCGGPLSNNIYRVDGAWSGGWVFGSPSSGSGGFDDRECMVYKCERFFGWSWQNDKCERRFRFLCMFDMDNSTCIGRGLTPTAETCIGYPESEPVSWFNAVLKCQELGGRLLEMTSALSHWAIRDALKEQCNLDSLWVGATKVDWIWANGDVLQYTNWAASRPASDGDKCVAMSYKLSMDYEWSDLNCDKTQSFVCERLAGAIKRTTTSTTATTTRPTTTTTTKGPEPGFPVLPASTVTKFRNTSGPTEPPVPGRSTPTPTTDRTGASSTDEQVDWIPIYIGIAVAAVVVLLILACLIYTCRKVCGAGSEKKATMRVENGYSNRAGFVHDGDFAYKTPATKNGGFPDRITDRPPYVAVTPNNHAPPISVVPPVTMDTKDGDFHDNITSTVTSATSSEPRDDAASDSSTVSSSSSVYIGELEDQGVGVKYVHPRDEEPRNATPEAARDVTPEIVDQPTLPKERVFHSRGPAPSPSTKGRAPAPPVENDFHTSMVDISTRL